MELCRFAASSTRHQLFLPLRSSRSSPLPKIPLALRSPPGIRSFGHRCSIGPPVSGGRLLRASEIDDVSYVGPKVETVEEEREVAKGEGGTVIEYEEYEESEEPEEDSSVAVEVLDFLKTIDLKEKLDFPILLYGTGAFIALWVSVAVVSALDSLLLIPKALEIVGLGYTVWFSYRYLVFKKNRDELAAKIKDLKEEILGPSD